jgi:hypothetical protein
LLANLAHYLTYSLCEQIDLALANYRSELGNALPVTVTREYTAEPTAKPPQIWVDTQLVRDEELDLIGDDAGADANGEVLHGGVFDRVPVDFGIRAYKAAEVDNLFDFLYLLRFAANPATNVRWAQELYVRRGVELLAVVPERKAPTPTSAYGQLYEITGRFLVRTACAVSIIYQPVTTITILPQVELDIPIGG